MFIVTKCLYQVEGSAKYPRHCFTLKSGSEKKEKEKGCLRYLSGNYTKTGGNLTRPRQAFMKPSLEIIIIGDKGKMSEVGISPNQILQPLNNITIAVIVAAPLCAPFQISETYMNILKENTALGCVSFVNVRHTAY